MKIIVKTFYHPIEWMFSAKYILLSTASIEIRQNVINVNSKFEDDNLKECLDDAKYRTMLYNALVKYHKDFSDITDDLYFNSYDKISINETIKKHFDNMTYESGQALVFEIKD